MTESTGARRTWKIVAWVVVILGAVVWAKVVALGTWIFAVLLVGAAQGAMLVSVLSVPIDKRPFEKRHAIFIAAIVALALLWFTPWWRFYLVSLGLAVSVAALLVVPDLWKRGVEFFGRRSTKSQGIGHDN
jgi:hypothetical protein